MECNKNFSELRQNIIYLSQYVIISLNVSSLYLSSLFPQTSLMGPFRALMEQCCVFYVLTMMYLEIKQSVWCKYTFNAFWEARVAFQMQF